MNNPIVNTPQGHNNPPLFDPDVYADLDRQVRQFADSAAEWQEIKKISDESQAEKLNDFIAGARKLFKQVEDVRKTEKQPHLDAGKQVDTAFKTLTGVLEKTSQMVKPLLEAYLQAKHEEAERQKRAEEARLKEEADKAEAARLAAEARNDVVGQQEAEQQAKATAQETIQIQKATPARVGSATGGGRTASLRTVRTAQIVNINQAMLYYREHPEMTTLLLRLATADIRAAKGDIALSGFQIITEKKI